jgi:DNA adenine methylase
MKKRQSSPLKYHGGKHYLAEWIIGQFPSHVHYVEPYFGSGAVLFRKPYVGVSEVINDIDRRLMTFWRVLQDRRLFQAFVRRTEATPFSQAVFEEARTAQTDDPVDVALDVFIQARQSRQGLGKDFATLSRNRTRRGMNEQASAWLTAVKGLPEAHERLNRVVILQGDALEVIRQQDGPNTLFYLDPPYVGETRVVKNSYRYEVDTSHHKSLLELLARIDGSFALSGYDSPMYQKAASQHGWSCVRRNIDCKAGGTSKKSKRIECLWMNY